MKKFLSLFVAVCAISFAVAQSGPVMVLTSTEVDYGTIDKGADPLRVVKFKNTGTEPLVVKSAKGSCGCTVPSYPQNPIMPGESNQIEIRYDTNRVGPFTKTVTLTTNESTETRIITIKGTVKDTPVAPSVPSSTPSVISTPRG